MELDGGSASRFVPPTQEAPLVRLALPVTGVAAVAAAMAALG